MPYCKESHTRLMASYHMQSKGNRYEIEDETLCGCFHCKSFFEGEDISEWVDEGKTALCPKCGIDSVLAEPRPKLLIMMHQEWFGGQQ